MHKKVISLSLHCQRWLIRFSWDNQFHISRKCLATDTGHSSDTDISQQLEQVQSLSTCRPSILSVYDLHCVLGLFKATCALCKASSAHIKIWRKYLLLHSSFRKAGFLSLQMYHVWIFMCSLKKKTKHQHCFLFPPQENRLLTHNYPTMIHQRSGSHLFGFHWPKRRGKKKQQHWFICCLQDFHTLVFDI